MKPTVADDDVWEFRIKKFNYCTELLSISMIRIMSAHAHNKMSKCKAGLFAPSTDLTMKYRALTLSALSGLFVVVQGLTISNDAATIHRSLKAADWSNMADQSA